MIAASQLSENSGDLDIERLFWAAHVLHTNFYEGNMGQAAVAEALNWVAQLVDKLEALLPEE